MPRILFWNVYKKDLTEHICSITAETNADAIVLLENKVPVSDILKNLKRRISDNFSYPNTIEKDSKSKFHCFTKNSKLNLSEIHTDTRYSARILQLGQCRTLLILVHGLDMLNYDDFARQDFAKQLADGIKFLQEDKKNEKVIVIGDFNMNPYERGMLSPTGMNTVMTRRCAEAGTRRFNRKTYDFFYNPMWSLFGDNSNGPAGTIYDTSSRGSYGWNMVDQVLIHHSIVHLFENVKILNQVGTLSLMNSSGRPNKSSFSDHFPIIVDFQEVKSD